MSVVGKKTQCLRDRYMEPPEVYKAFASGFAAGQAEKVFLNCCPAAMFRPSKEHFEWYKSEVEVIANVFNLRVVILDSHCPDTPHEIWICKDSNEVGKWLEHPLNSKEWHSERAVACGIPLNCVDFNYHLRNGYGEKCD